MTSAKPSKSLNQFKFKKDLYTKVISDMDVSQISKMDFGLWSFIQKTVLDGIWFWDVEEPDNLYLSPEYWRSIGYEPGEKPNRPDSFQEVCHPDDVPKITEALKKHFKNPAYPYDLNIRLFHKNGKLVYLRCRGKALRNKEGRAIKMFGAHIKITEQQFNQEAKLLLKTTF